MRPPKREFEKVPVGVPVLGVIEEVLYHENHTFPGFDGKEDTTATAIRFKFTLTDCQYFHYSRWMRLSLNTKATLYKKYASELIEGLVPDADIDLDILNGVAVSTIWSNNGDFQNLDSISAVGPKIKIMPEVNLDEKPEEEPPVNESVPF